MQLTPDDKQAIKEEMIHFGRSLNLSEDQKTRLKTALEHARERIEEARKTHPGLSKEDIKVKLKEARPVLREHLVHFLTPEQLTKWDAEVLKAKSFLGITAH